MLKSKIAMLLQWIAAMAIAAAGVQGASKCSEFKGVMAQMNEPEQEWVAVLETLPIGHRVKFCLVFDIRVINSTTVKVDARRDDDTAQFLMTLPGDVTSLTTLDLHLEGLPDPPKLGKTFHLAHFRDGHYYCFVQCSLNYDLYDDYVACFTTQRKMSDEDKADVDQFVDKLGFQLNVKNTTAHIDTSSC